MQYVNSICMSHVNKDVNINLGLIAAAAAAAAVKIGHLQDCNQKRIWGCIPEIYFAGGGDFSLSSLPF